MKTHIYVSNQVSNPINALTIKKTGKGNAHQGIKHSIPLSEKKMAKIRGMASPSDHQYLFFFFFLSLSLIKISISYYCTFN